MSGSPAVVHKVDRIHKVDSRSAKRTHEVRVKVNESMKTNSRVTNVKRKPRKGAYLVYSFQKAQGAYFSPLSMLSEALALCDWKNVSADELREFKKRLNEKIRTVSLGRAKRKYNRKRKPSERGLLFIEFRKWSQRVNAKYSKALFETWLEARQRGLEPVWTPEE